MLLIVPNRRIDRWLVWSDQLRYDQMLPGQQEAERRRRICEQFDAQAKKSRRRTVRAVVETTQRLTAAAPDALRILPKAGNGNGYALYRFVQDVRRNRVELDLDGAQRLLFDRWVDATLAALAEGVDEDFLHALILKVAPNLRCHAPAARRFRRAISGQLQRLEHSIERHAPPVFASAGPRLALSFSAEVMTTA